MLAFVGRAIADRLTPGSVAWRTAADIDAGSIATALGLPPGAVASIEIVAIDHGTTQRSRLVVHHADGTATPLFVKNTPVKLGARLLDGTARLCEREASFYRHVAPAVPAAPRALISKWHARTGRSTLVLPDLGELGFEFRPSAESCTPEQVGLALDALAVLHASRIAAADDSRAFDTLYLLNSSSMRRLSRLVCRTIGRGPKALRALVPDGVLESSRVLATHAREYSDVLAGFPQAFIHNDTHRGNIGFTSDRAIFIDWQGCGWGPALKDVAYLMVTALEPGDRRLHERSLLDRYVEQVRLAGGAVTDREDAWFAYRVLAITGYVAAGVTAMFRDRLQAAANATESLRRAASAVQDLESFAALRQQIDKPRKFP